MAATRSEIAALLSKIEEDARRFRNLSCVGVYPSAHDLILAWDYGLAVRFLGDEKVEVCNIDKASAVPFDCDIKVYNGKHVAASVVCRGEALKKQAQSLDETAKLLRGRLQQLPVD